MSIRCNRCLFYLVILAFIQSSAFADSVNSPNITMNVDLNRTTGPGAGNTSITVNTITIAEIQLPEYSSGTGKSFTLQVSPGYQFDPSSAVSAQSATIGFNGLGVNVAASRTPAGIANEALTFNLTSGTNSGVQDIIRLNGVKLRILNSAGAAGPAQTTIRLTTSSMGGAFTNQGIVAANITKGAADRLVFAAQPGNSQAAANLLPSVKIVDFGGNVITNDSRTISLSLQTNPGSATLLGTTQLNTNNGLATWSAGEGLNITAAATGYSLRASHSGTVFLSSDTIDSSLFNITAGNPGSLVISTQPVETAAGNDILLTVGTADEFGNPTTANGIEITLDSAINPGGWPLLVDTSLTKTTTNGSVSWGADDNLRINKAISGYQLSVSGLGSTLLTNTFDIVPGSPSLLRFVQQPTNTLEGQVVNPPVTVEVLDNLANRVSSALSVELTSSSSECSITLSGNTADAIAGLATFSSLASSQACSDTTLLASASGVAGAASDTIDFRAEDAKSIAIKSTQIKKGKLFKFSSSGDFSVPSSTIDDPTKNGAKIVVTGTTGAVVYKLPKAGWKKNGSKGFQFTGAKCQSVKIGKNNISASCESKTGTIQIPETAIDIVLSVGKGTARFCGNCGGTSVGNQSKIFKRTNCAAAEACP